MQVCHRSVFVHHFPFVVTVIVLESLVQFGSPIFAKWFIYPIKPRLFIFHSDFVYLVIADGMLC